jgi:hypothetical protein
MCCQNYECNLLASGDFEEQIKFFQGSMANLDTSELQQNMWF